MTETLYEPEDLSKLGEIYLDKLGFGNLKDEPISISGVPYLIDGKSVPAKNFLNFCGEHVIPMFDHLETLTPNSEEHANYLNELRSAVTIFVRAPETET